MTCQCENQSDNVSHDYTRHTHTHTCRETHKQEHTHTVTYFYTCRHTHKTNLALKTLASMAPYRCSADNDSLLHKHSHLRRASVSPALSAGFIKPRSPFRRAPTWTRFNKCSMFSADDLARERLHWQLTFTLPNHFQIVAVCVWNILTAASRVTQVWWTCLGWAYCIGLSRCAGLPSNMPVGSDRTKQAN